MDEEAQEFALAEAAAGGDRDAFSRLILRNHASVLRYVESKRPATAPAWLSAEEVVQEAVIKAINGIRGFKPENPGSFLAWLRMIAHNTLIDMMRKGKRTPVCDAPPARGGDSSSTYRDGVENAARESLGPGEKAGKAELIGAFHVALAELSDEYQQVIRLHYLGHQSIAEVAAQMGISEGAARGLRDRAKQRLGEAIGRLSLYM
ncbi:MAG: RNA polymerase sigma factor [Lacipirellulaceae bacterium]